MNKIKVRGWSEENKSFVYGTLTDDWIWTMTVMPLKVGTVLNHKLSSPELSIGLSDKNDKEIYDGDIVRFCFSIDGGYDSQDATEMIDVVRLEEGAAFFVSDTGAAAYSRLHNKYCEVIGNIHENPELLRGHLWLIENNES